MIITRTPFRVSFAGGGTDLREFYSHESGSVISTSINKYIYVHARLPNRGASCLLRYNIDSK